MLRTRLLLKYKLGGLVGSSQKGEDSSEVNVAWDTARTRVSVGE